MALLPPPIRTQIHVRLRQQLKWYLFGPLGRFRYFGETVFFPPWSLSFRAACEQGVFEQGNVAFLTRHALPNTLVFDVGANIGLMAIPVLCSCDSCTVISFEPSPNALPYLRRTIAVSSFRSRWQLVEKAIGPCEGKTSFSVSHLRQSLFDGTRDTHRAAAAVKIEVAMTTIDAVWKSNGSPQTSLIKCDVEGGELAVLKGARDCLMHAKPAVLTEWNSVNLAAHDCDPNAILSFAAELDYRVFAAPELVEVTDATQLKLQMMRSETFVLLPR
jgi:FkbM family methyltransferase